MTILANWLWQGLLVAGAAAILIRVCPRLNAATRHGLWWMALLTIAVLPVVPAAAGSLIAWIEPARQALPAATLGAAANTGLAARALALPVPPFWFVGAALAAWMLFAATRLGRIVHSLTTMTGLKRDSTPIDPAREAQLTRWPAARNAGRRCEMRVSDRVRGACVAGFRHPAILLPSTLLHALSNEELDQVVLHEHAHVVRYDDWSRLAQCLVTAVLGVHPIVWAINRQIDLEREAACDDRVVAETRAARLYAACLARVAAVQLAWGTREPSIAPAAARSRRLLQARILRLIDRESPETVGLRWASVTLGLATLGTTVLAAGLTPPPITFISGTTAALDALPAVSLRWDAALQTARASEVFSTSAMAERAKPSPVSATASAEAPSAGDTPDDVPSGQVLPVSVATSTPEPAMPRSPLASDAIGADLLPALPDPLPATAIDPQPRASSVSGSPGSAFADFGTHAAHAGVALGTHLQAMGGNLGGWFTRIARHVSTP